MFPGRRLTRWCQLVPRVLMVAPGKLFVAKAASANEQQMPSTQQVIETTHCFSLRKQHHHHDQNHVVIVIAESEASSYGDVGFVFLKVPLAVALELQLVTQYSASSSPSSSSPPQDVPKSRQEAVQRQRASETAIANCLRFLIKNRTVLEKGTADSSCLIFEVNGTSQQSGDYARQRIVDLVRAGSGLQVHLLYSTFALIDFVCSNSKITEMIATKLTHLVKGEETKRYQTQKRNNDDENSKNVPQRLPPKMNIPRPVLMKKLNEAVTPKKEPEQTASRPRKSDHEDDIKPTTRNEDESANINDSSTITSSPIVTIEEIDEEITSTHHHGDNKIKQETEENENVENMSNRERMMRLIKLAGERKQRRIDELERMNQDYALLAEADATIERSDRVVKQYLRRMGNISENPEREYYYPLDDEDNVDEDLLAMLDHEPSIIIRKSTSPSVRRHLPPQPPPPISAEENFCRMQELFLSLIVLKICNQKVSSRFANEIVDAERKLL